MDEQPRFHLEAVRWYISLVDVVGVAPTDLVVHVVGSSRSDALDLLRAGGVAVREVDRFDRRSPHCNKISGALDLADQGVDGTAVLCDADVVLLEDPRRLHIPPGGVAGKPVDRPLPPVEALTGVFAAAGVTMPPSVPLAWGTDEWTVSGNCNGGLYLVHGSTLSQVASAWATWASWLLDRPELLSDWTVHVDQVAMALGLASERLAVEPLDVRWNLPVHDPGRFPPDPPSPAVIHYHQEVDGQGLLRLTGLEPIDARIRVVNGAIGARWHRSFPADTFRRWSDAVGGTRAVGTDTRDDRAVVTEVLRAIRPSTVLQVGRDGGVADADVDGVEVTTIDDDQGWTEHARPDPREGTHPTEPLAELIVCLGLAGRQPDVTAQQDLVARLWNSASRGLVVAGPERPSHGVDSREPHVNEPLVDTLGRVAPEAELYPVHRGDRCVVVALRPPEQRHPRDFTQETWAPLTGRHPDPLALMTVRVHAWRTLGFYPDHAPRLWEYPVVARLVAETLPTGSRLLDIGAGTTPLAPYLTTLGYVVDTVDPSTQVRGWPPRDDWNEWGYLDYGRARLAHRSWNTTLDRLPPLPLFDGLVSVSVIEHVPGDVRRALLHEFAHRVRDGGLVVLTVDLVRGSDDLWNRNLGVEVEDPSDHGTLQEMIDEAGRAGLEPVDTQTIRYWGTGDIDIALIVLRRGDRPGGQRAGRGRRGMRGLARRLRTGRTT